MRGSIAAAHSQSHNRLIQHNPIFVVRFNASTAIWHQTYIDDHNSSHTYSSLHMRHIHPLPFPFEWEPSRGHATHNTTLKDMRELFRENDDTKNIYLGISFMMLCICVAITIRNPSTCVLHSHIPRCLKRKRPILDMCFYIGW